MLKVTVRPVLVVGTGGIGCEVIKCLVCAGFKNIHLVDKDVIELTNLNRQFLFQMKDIGKSKAEVAKDFMVACDPTLHIVPHFGDILSSNFDVHFYETFSIVINALDNREARSHVNRMCLAANVPLVDGGTAGYLGQTTVIIKDNTECYDCVTHPIPTVYPTCTIRSTPSELIHCIVWSKHLFAQLFSNESCTEDDISPETLSYKDVSETKSLSTAQWYAYSDYCPRKLLHKLFIKDIETLQQMEQLWETRKKPHLLDMELINKQFDCDGVNIYDDSFISASDKEMWSLEKSVSLFIQCTNKLTDRFKNEVSVAFEKDDNLCMGFVIASCFIRAHLFGIEKKTPMEVKTMAGNIIPAIVTTNDIIASLSVVEALKILTGERENCRQCFLSSNPMSNWSIISAQKLNPPNPGCYICSPKPKVVVCLDVHEVTVKDLKDQIIIKSLGISHPDVEIDDGKGSLLISSEECETNHNLVKKLDYFGIKDGSILKIENFSSEYKLNLHIKDTPSSPNNDSLFFKILKEEGNESDSEETEKSDSFLCSQSSSGRPEGDGGYNKIKSPIKANVIKGIKRKKRLHSEEY